MLDELQKSDRVKIVQDVSVPGSIARWELGAGETQVISLAVLTPRSEVVIDDLAARKCARTMGCQMIGTVGAILVAKQRGVIPAVRPLLTQLLDSGLRLSESMVQAVLAAAEES
jgi:predicted nucleic acid-binding protein